MSSLLTPSDPERERLPGTMYVSGGGTNSLYEFRSEEDVRATGWRRAAAAVRPWPRLPLALLVAAVVTGLMTTAYVWMRAAPAAAASAERPAAAPPATAATPPMASPTPAAVKTGTLDVSSDPPGARVLVDGAERGVTPLTLPDIEPGAREVSIVSGRTTVNRTVQVDAGGTATVVASVVAARPGPGWLTIDMPFEADIVENGRLLGTTSTPQLALPAGWHELELRNTSLGFEASLSVQILPGQVARPGVAPPTGRVSINATPWARVTIDGREAGVTPLANLSVPLGTHDIVFTHPRLGERRQTIQVIDGEPVRIGVSFDE